MKAEMIRVDVLGPKTVRDILDDLSSTEGEAVYFSVAIDASNKGNEKGMFPVCVRYFSDGVHCKLLDFYEDSDEKANGIHQALINCLEKYELDNRHIS